MDAKTLLHSWQCNIRVRRRLHFLAAKSYHRWNVWTSSIIVFLSSLNGGVGFFYSGTSMSQEKSDDERITTSYIISSLNIIIASISAVSQYCPFELKSAQHQHISEQFENLERDIETTLLHDNITKDDMDSLKGIIHCLVEKAPIVPESVNDSPCPELLTNV